MVYYVGSPTLNNRVAPDGEGTSCRLTAKWSHAPRQRSASRSPASE